MRGLWFRRAMFLLIVGVLGWVFMVGYDHGEQAHGLSQETHSTQTNPVESGLRLPYTLSGSGLIVEEIVSYDGVYWEDHEGDIVSQVTALMLYNPAERMVQFGAVALEQDGKQLYFFVYCLPPKSRCLVLEKHKQPFSNAAITQCRELNVRWDYQDLKREEVDYVGFGQSLTVTNRTSRQQKHVTVWYKQYAREEECYLGGVAYSAHLFRLNPGEQRTLTPTHYEAGQSKVVSIDLE